MGEKVSVLGLGNWGTALANHLSGIGHDVLGWCFETDIPPAINSKHQNPRYQSGVTLNQNLRATNNLGEALARDVLILVVPSHVLSDVLKSVRIRANSLIISAIKGLDAQSLDTPLQLAKRVLPSGVKLSVLSGPSFARDVIRGMPCGVVAASVEEDVSKRVATIFSGGSMRVYTSSDPLGVELGGVVKNVIALAAGVCDGMGLGDSARAGLITRGLAEMMRLAVAMGADMRTLSGLSGLGDLVMTATCDTSRNRTVGLKLGKGEKLSEIVATLGSVAEAVHTAPLVLKLAEKYKVDMPISFEVDRLLREEISPKQMVSSLMARPIRSEH